MIDPLLLSFFISEIQKEAGVGSAIKGGAKWVADAAVTGAKETGSRSLDFIKNPVKATISGAKDGWNTSAWNGFGGKAANRTLLYGGTAYGAKHDISEKEDPVTHRQIGRGERIGRTIGGAATGLATAPAGLVAGMGVSMAGGAGGARLGRLADKGINKLRGKKAPVTPAAGDKA